MGNDSKLLLHFWQEEAIGNVIGIAGKVRAQKLGRTLLVGVLEVDVADLMFTFFKD
jgi:hypothetical protein